jgi:hypothetical protein
MKHVDEAQQDSCWREYLPAVANNGLCGKAGALEVPGRDIIVASWQRGNNSVILGVMAPQSSTQITIVLNELLKVS